MKSVFLCSLMDQAIPVFNILDKNNNFHNFGIDLMKGGWPCAETYW